MWTSDVSSLTLIVWQVIFYGVVSDVHAFVSKYGQVVLYSLHTKCGQVMFCGVVSDVLCLMFKVWVCGVSCFFTKICWQLRPASCGVVTYMGGVNESKSSDIINKTEFEN